MSALLAYLCEQQRVVQKFQGCCALDPGDQDCDAGDLAGLASSGNTQIKLVLHKYVNV